MAGNILGKFGTANQGLTITLASLAFSNNFLARESTAVDNSSDLALDALVTVRCHVGTVAAPKLIAVYAYGTVDAGGDAGGGYTGKATGTDAAFGPATVANQCLALLRMIGIIPTETNAVKYEGGPFSVAAAFGGTLPEKWGIVVQNQSGAALDASTVDNCAKYQIIFGSYT